MTANPNLEAKPSAKLRRRAAHPEDDLQGSIVRFHAQAVSQAHAVLYAVPNGEKRDGATAARLTGMSAATRAALPETQCLIPAGLGVLPGAADLVLLLSQARLVLIEVKIPKIVWPPVGEGFPLFKDVKRVVLHEAGKQMPVQKRFQAGAELLGHDYRIIRTVTAYGELLAEKGVPMRFRPRWGT